MEKYVLGYFREQLSKIIIGFREEQVNANLLNGKGEIRDLQINCSVVNKMVSQLVPFAAFEEVHVSRLGFQVTSWANIRKAPIVVNIGCITAVVEEPLNYVIGMKKTGIRMFTEKELARMIEEELLKPFRKTGAYGIVDRITDNLTIEIEKIDISFSTMGRFKTKRVGPWTPPVLHIECRNFRSTAVDIHGHEGTPEQIWEHNHRRNQAFLLCRKVTLETCVRLKSPEKEITVIKELKLEVQLALRQRLRDGHILGIQSDVTIPLVDIALDQDNLPMVASLVAGLQYCVIKDRSYEDPLNSKSSAKGDSALASVISSSRTDNPNDEKTMTDKVTKEVTPEIDDDNISRGSSSSSEGDDTVLDTAQSSTNTSKVDVWERPVLVLPLGIIIHQDVCITASIHQAVLRGSYAGAEEGCMQLTARGTIAELIWPKTNSEFGFHSQASVAYCTLEELYDHQRTTLFINGIIREEHSSMGKKLNAEEINSDESFPFFEKRSIRNDPLELRRVFPSQGVGQKVTVDFLNKALSRPKVFNETGINHVEIIFDLQPWWRVIRFVLNESGGGYDPRLYSGDWSDVLTVDMLQDPAKPIDLDDQLQFTKQKFLGDDYMISSDVFSAVVRCTNIVIRCPAGIKESVRACDLVMELKEATVTVTSDLPRTFLTGKLSNGAKNTKVEFPNDPSDIPFQIESGQDSQALPSSTSSSTFRQQITVRGFQMRIIPVVPFYNSPDPQQLFAPTDVTVIASLEGEKPSVDDEPAKLVFFLSIHVHKAFLNLDLDLIAGMTSTLLYHSDTVFDALKQIEEMESIPKNKTEVRNQKVVKKSIKGRQEMLRRQVLRSKATAGLSIVVCLQLSEFGLSIWRQNIPLESPVISTDSTGTGFSFDASHIAALRLLDVQIDNFEVGAEFGFRNDKVSRTVLKCCLELFQVRLCRVRNPMKQSSPTLSSDAQESEDNMVELLLFGGKPRQDKMPCTPKEDQPIAIRCEELKCNDSKTWSVSAKVMSSAVLNLYFDELKDCAAMCIEALMMPSWSKRRSQDVDKPIFPPKSLGAFFQSLVPQRFSIGTMAKNVDIGFGSDFDEPAVERMMKKFLEEFLPGLDVILCRCELANFAMQVPFDPSNKKKQIGLILNQSDLSMMICPDSDRLAKEIAEVLSIETSEWHSMMASRSSGLHLGFLSRSSLFARSSADANSNTQVLVQPCGIDLTYSGGRFDLSMSDNLRIGDIRLIEAQVLHVKEIMENCRARTLDLVAQLSTLPAWSSSKSKRNGVDMKEKPYEGGENGPRNLHAVRNSRSILDMLHNELVEYEQRVRVELRKMDAKVAQLQKEVFVKERERFAAMSLLASRASGWIRMGGVHLVGQRFTRKATMLPYWMILRKDLLLLFSAPGELRPLDAVTLEGVAIRDLGGAGIKRGFAIIERDDTTRFFVCESAADYMVWMNDLSAAVLACNGTIDVGESLDENGDAGGTLEKSPGNMDTVEGEGLGLREKINLSNRLAGAKNKFGSAIQTARQKGRVVSDTARQKSKEMSDRFEGSSKGSLGSMDMLESEDTRSTTGNSTTGGEGNDGKGRFSRFGSALQNARQRVRETAEEKQGSLAGLRNKISRLPKADNRPTEVEVVHNDSVEIFSWKCIACTYMNSVENIPTVQSTCEMCGSHWQPEEISDLTGSIPGAPLPNDANMTTSNQNPLTPVEESQEGNTDENRFDANRRGFLGIGGGLPKQDGMNLQGRFNFRKKNSDISDRYAPITMRDIFARGRAPPLPDHELVSEPLKSFEGRWIVSVTPESIDSDPSTSKTNPEQHELSADSTYEQDSDLTQKPSSAPGEDLPVLFRIKVRQVDKNFKDSSSEKLCRLGDIFEIYTQVSEDLERVAAQLLPVDIINAQIASSERESVVDKLVVCGMMLGGILEMDEMPNLVEKTRNYQADVLEGFLNSVLECPMPVGTLGSLTEVLGICTSTKDVSLGPPQTESRIESAQDETVTSMNESSGNQLKADIEGGMVSSVSQLESEKMLALISTCGAQMLRAEQSSARPTKEKPQTQPETENFPDPVLVGKFTTFGSPLLPVSIQEELQRSLHNAIVRIMAERDTTNAQLIGSSVLHTHALEAEKRKNRLLELELEVLRRLSQTNQPGGNLFRGQSAANAPHKDLEAKVKKLQLENSDEMMVALSQQLGVEIHAKTELEAEIKRMKESDKLKSEIEMAENKELKKELKRVKELLAAEERSKQSAFMEAENWKASYEGLKAKHGETK